MASIILANEVVYTRMPSLVKSSSIAFTSRSLHHSELHMRNTLTRMVVYQSSPSHSLLQLWVIYWPHGSVLGVSHWTLMVVRLNVVFMNGKQATIIPSKWWQVFTQNATQNTSKPFVHGARLWVREVIATQPWITVGNNWLRQGEHASLDGAEPSKSCSVSSVSAKTHDCLSIWVGSLPGHLLVVPRKMAISAMAPLE